MHLFAAFLGGELSPGRMGEDHEVVFVVAEDMLSARKAATAKWGGDGRPHGDATETEGYNSSPVRRRATAPRRG